MDVAQDMARMSLFHNLRSGNIIIDIMMSTMVACLFSNILRLNFFKIIYEFDFFDCGEKTISLTCRESSNYNGKKIMDTSETFRSVLYYIKASIKKGSVSSLNKLSEYYSYQYDDYDEENMDNKNTKFSDTIYLVNQRGVFNIDTPESKDIYFKMTKDSCQIPSDSRSKDTKTSITHTLKISSKVLSLKELQSFVDKLHLDYNDMINKQFDNKQHVFVYEGMDSSYNTKFKSYPFETTCDISKVFFENKDKLMNQINFFKDNKDWYTDKGKPYTLGICNYGMPGCGKTSFEKAICKYLNRHMIIVDFSRIKYMQEADDIFFSETINNKIIPYDKRLYVFPDIDRMTDLLYDGEYKEEILQKTFSKFKKKLDVKDNTNNEVFLKQILSHINESSDLKLTNFNVQILRHLTNKKQTLLLSICQSFSTLSMEFRKEPGKLLL